MFVSGTEERKLVDNISPGGWAYYNNKSILASPISIPYHYDTSSPGSQNPFVHPITAIQTPCP
jgi:hypothetical protein